MLHKNIQPVFLNLLLELRWLAAEVASIRSKLAMIVKVTGILQSNVYKTSELIPAKLKSTVQKRYVGINIWSVFLKFGSLWV